MDPGVYLPSNPESIVIDIDYDSGRPLQSHAKVASMSNLVNLQAPYMATFKIRRPLDPCDIRVRRQSSYQSLYLQDDQEEEVEEEVVEEYSWQSAIFKVSLLHVI